jgi:predicted transcriptional regulator
MGNQVVTANVPADLAKRLDGLADLLGRSRAWVVKEALESYVGFAEERHRETLAALRDVDMGRLVECAEVESWLGGLGGARRGKGRAKATG